MRSIFVLIFICLSAAVQAGEFGPGTPEKCQIRFDGDIGPGDAAGLRDRLGEFALGAGDTEGQMICLSGSGGALGEALHMGQVLVEHGIGTRVEANTECLGSCAVLFMMGSRLYYDDFQPDKVDRRFAHRVMHASARVGFVRPELERARDPAAAMDAMIALVRMANEPVDGGVTMAPDLLQEMLADRDGDVFFLATTGQTARWQVALDGARLPERMDARGAWHACHNLANWPVRYEAEVPAFDDAAVRTIEMDFGGPVHEIFGAYATDAPHYCLLQYEAPQQSLSTAFGAAGGLLYACGVLDGEDQPIGRRRCYSADEADLIMNVAYDERAFLPATTRLTDIAIRSEAPAALTSRSTPRTAAPVADDGRMVLTIPQLSAKPRARPETLVSVPRDGLQAFRAQCSANSGAAYIDNVNSFTNLRPDATIGDPVLEEVPRGMQVQLVAGMKPDVGGISSNCSQLCQKAGTGRLSGAESAALDACYDRNAYWFRVRTPSGREGYLSGKFLRK